MVALAENISTPRGTTPGTIRVLLADDHAVLRQGLRRLLESESAIDVIGEAHDGTEAVARARELRPDLVVMDLAMPGMNGLDAARALLRAAPGSKILILSMHADRELVDEALGAGIAAWVTKDTPADALVRAIRSVAQGTEPATFITAEGAQRWRPATEQKGKADLTPREREILQLLAEGKTCREIGELLGISTKTADVHKTNLMRKLDIHSRVELVKYALAKKVIRL